MLFFSFLLIFFNVNSQSIDKGTRYAVYQDYDFKKHPEELTTKNFSLSEGIIPNLGWGKFKAWVILKPESLKGKKYLLIQNPVFDEIKIYKDSSKINTIKPGTLFSEREVSFRFPTFNIENIGQKEIYISGITSLNPAKFPIRLFDEAGLTAFRENQALLNGLIFGFIAILVLLNLIIFAVFKLRPFGVFAISAALFATLYFFLEGYFFGKPYSAFFFENNYLNFHYLIYFGFQSCIVFVTTIDVLDIITKLFLAALFGGLIGFERKNHKKPAGLRTNMLICIGSALVMILSQHLSYSVPDSDLLTGKVTQRTVGDPARLAAQVISGIGFLGAGAILHSRTNGAVLGLTTAATIWTNAAIGLAIGAGFYILGGISTAFVLFTLYVVRMIETRTNATHPKPRTLLIILKNVKKIAQLKKEIYRKGIFIDSESIKKRMDEVEYRAEINISPLMEEALLNHLSEDDNILSFNITSVQ